MRAVRQHEFGDQDVLQIDEIDRPSPHDDEVLVNVRAAGVNGFDITLQSGTKPRELPRTIGLDFAGVVEAVGKRVTSFDVGDRVFGGWGGLPEGSGTYADYLTIPANRVAPLPDNLSFEEGAIGHIGITAWKALVIHGDLTTADTVLIHGGAGGVGHLAIQIAAASGAHVITTVGSPEERAFVNDIGADTILDYTRDDLAEAIDTATDFNPDVIIDHRPQDYLELDIDVAGEMGRIVLLSGPGGRHDNAPVARNKKIQIHYVGTLHLSRTGQWLSRIGRLCSASEISIEVTQTYDMEDASEAQRAYLETDIGIIVVTT